MMLGNTGVTGGATYCNRLGRVGAMRTSENFYKTKFAALPFYALRCIGACRIGYKSSKDARREGSMAARLLLLLVMLVFAVLRGCAQEAANDRQPMKRVKQPTSAEIAPHTPEESDDQVRRAKKAGVVVRAGNSAVVARAG